MVADALSRPPAPQNTPETVQQAAALPPTSFAASAEDLPEEGLAAPEMTGGQGVQANINRSGTPAARQTQQVAAQPSQVLAAVAKAQPVDFSAMAQLQQSCREVLEMLASRASTSPLRN
jgi:hypothetical protein